MIHSLIARSRSPLRSHTHTHAHTHTHTPFTVSSPLHLSLLPFFPLLSSHLPSAFLILTSFPPLFSSPLSSSPLLCTLTNQNPSAVHQWGPFGHTERLISLGTATTKCHRTLNKQMYTAYTFNDTRAFRHTHTHISALTRMFSDAQLEAVVLLERSDPRIRWWDQRRSVDDNRSVCVCVCVCVRAELTAAKWNILIRLIETFPLPISRALQLTALCPAWCVKRNNHSSSFKDSWVVFFSMVLAVACVAYDYIVLIAEIWEHGSRTQPDTEKTPFGEMTRLETSYWPCLHAFE